MVTRDDPNLDAAVIAACLNLNYGIRAVDITFLPIGFDLAAFVYRVTADDGETYFLKGRSDVIHEPGLRVARGLADAGFTSVVAPLPTRSADLWCRLGESAAILYPFVAGEGAMVAGMSDNQWVTLGRTLRAVHDRGLESRRRDDLPVEAFDLTSANLVREMAAHVASTSFDGPAAAGFARFWIDHLPQIDGIVARAESLGKQLQGRSFDLVLCHADIHAANIVVGAGDDGPIHLVDWDGPLIAPRERDLLFVVGSTIARPVEPREEILFFQGYGPVAIDPTALAYYRYERFVQDLGEIGRSILFDRSLSEQTRRDEAAVAMDYFAPRGFLDRAETIDRHGW